MQNDGKLRDIPYFWDQTRNTRNGGRGIYDEKTMVVQWVPHDFVNGEGLAQRVASPIGAKCLTNLVGNVTHAVRWLVICFRAE